MLPCFVIIIAVSFFHCYKKNILGKSSSKLKMNVDKILIKSNCDISKT